MRSDDDDASWYRSAFPDAFEPRVVFLVHSDERRRKVERAVKERLGIIAPSEFKVIVLTFAEAPALLARYVRDGVAEPAAPRRDRVVRVDETVLGQVRDGYNAMCEALNACRTIINEHNQRGGPQLKLPAVPRGAGTLRSFVLQLTDADVAPDEVPAKVLPPTPPRTPAPPWVQR